MEISCQQNEYELMLDEYNYIEYNNQINSFIPTAKYT